MYHRLAMFVLTALAATYPGNASAEPVNSSPIFDIPAVPEQLLANVRGTAYTYAALSQSSVYRLTDAQSRSDFRHTGSITVLQMDAWWGTIGSELIANAVRTGGGTPGVGN